MLFQTKSMNGWRRVLSKNQIQGTIFPFWEHPKRHWKTDVRVCFDARFLNKHIQPDDYPLPLIRDIFEVMGKYEYFATLDLADAFHQLPVDPRRKHYLCFTWNGAKYCFVKTPFGIKTVPSFIQRLMEKILRPMNDFCRVFIDDIVISGNSVEELTRNINQILSTLTLFNFREEGEM